MKSPISLLLLAIASVLSIAPRVSAQRVLDRSEVKALNGVAVDEQLGNHVPLDATFTNSDGQEVELGSYFNDDKPVILVMVYYECPVVCPVVLSQLTVSLNKLEYDAGKDFRILVVSFDPTETTSMALGKRTNFLGEYNKGTTNLAKKGIAFHTGDAPNIKRLVNSIGFNFNPLDNGQFAHPVSLMILSPKGKVTRYMYGFNYPPKELKLSLLDASKGKIAKSLGDRLLHFCYQYDPNAGVYSIQAMQVMKIGALLTMVVLALGISLLLMGERARRRKHLGQQLEQPFGQPFEQECNKPGSNGPNNHDSLPSEPPSGRLTGAHTGHVS